MKKTIRVEVSARHVHLTKHDLEVLFGEGYELKRDKDLSQPGQYASVEVVTLVGTKRNLENVRVLGPCRGNSQVEISRTDSFYLGSPAPLRLSGKIIGSGSIKLVGPKGEVELKEGLIVAKRHVHLNLTQAKDYGVSNGQNIKIEIDGPRSIVFSEVEVRIDENFDEAVHLDTDEANAAGFTGEEEARLIIK
ncbi:MAG: Phosphate propanoyltransferase [Parcubacteria group bacterium GW2011_GWC2_38_7]|nr:MAG: Phosphate propanoyltransferase [Parcubacteria group bacterium GW2011_GWC2_38_7]